MNLVKKIDGNKNRALFIAKAFIPDEFKSLYYKELCNGCMGNDGNEHLECCYCQDGNNYEHTSEV